MQRLIALLLLCLSTITVNAAEPWVTDESHTRITFTVDHLGYSTMPGIFREFDVEFHFDPENPANSTLNVVIETASIDMFHDGLNDHMRAHDFFDVENHPQMTFTSTSVEMTGENTATVTGDFTLLGVTKPISLEVVMNKMAPNFRGKMVAGFDATGAIDRTEFGMDTFAPILGSVANIALTAEFSPPE